MPLSPKGVPVWGVPNRPTSALTCAHFPGRSRLKRQISMQNLPEKLPLAETAFFFDFDGTLVELASTPDGVVVSPAVAPILTALRRATNGAVAIVSGRGIDSIDSFLKMPDIPVAGLHGAERRDSNADVHRVGFNDERLMRMEHVLEGVMKANPGMLLEIKGARSRCIIATRRSAARRRARRRNDSSRNTPTPTFCSPARWSTRSSRRTSIKAARCALSSMNRRSRDAGRCYRRRPDG